MKRKKTQNSQHNTEEEQNEWTLLNFKSNYKTTVINTVWYWQNRQMYQ